MLKAYEKQPVAKKIRQPKIKESEPVLVSNIRIKKVEKKSLKRNKIVAEEINKMSAEVIAPKTEFDDIYGN